MTICQYLQADQYVSAFPVGFAVFVFLEHSRIVKSIEIFPICQLKRLFVQIKQAQSLITFSCHVAQAESEKAKTFQIARFLSLKLPDKARKWRQFTKSRQMRINGGFARFPDHTDIVLDHPNPL